MPSIYGSETVSQLIALLDLGSDSSLRQREIARRLGIQLSSVQAALAQLEKRGLIQTEQKEGYQLYRINRDDPRYPGVHRVALVDAGVSNLLSSHSDEITFALIFGSVARGDPRSDSDLDLLVVSSLPDATIEAMLAPLAKRLQRRIDVANLDYFSFVKRLRNADALVSKALAEGTVVMGSTPQ